METRLAWLHISFRCFFFPTAVASSSSTGCNPPPPLPSLTAIFHHSPSIGFLVPQQATQRTAPALSYRPITLQTTYHAPLFRSNKQTVTNHRDLRNQSEIVGCLLADSRNGTGRIHGSQLNLTDLNFCKMSHSWIFSAVPGVGYSIFCLSFIWIELSKRNREEYRKLNNIPVILGTGRIHRVHYDRSWVPWCQRLLPEINIITITLRLLGIDLSIYCPWLFLSIVVCCV